MTAPAAALAAVMAGPLLAGDPPASTPPASTLAPAPSPPAGPVAPAAITKERALEIARRKVAALAPAAFFTVLEKKTIEKPFGWVFFYEPKAAATDPGAMVPGAGPLVVHRDGSTTFLSTSVPPAEAIAEYEKVWARRQGRRP